GVTRVEFYDGTTLKSTVTVSPYMYPWTFTAADNGVHSWTAKAYDAAGNVGTSATVTLTINIGTADTQPPPVSLPTHPASTSPSAQPLTIPSPAPFHSGVPRVEFYDGTPLKSTAPPVPYTFAWAFTTTDNGAHSWTAKAYDAAGNSTASAAVVLT